MRLTVIGIAAAALAAAVLAGPAASAGVNAGTPQAQTQQLLLQGEGHGVGVRVHVSATGAFTDYGMVDLSARLAHLVTLRLSKGELFLRNAKLTGVLLPFNRWTCTGTYALVAQFWVVGGTGRYKWATGWGQQHTTVVQHFDPVVSRICSGTNIGHPPGSTTFFAVGQLVLPPATPGA